LAISELVPAALPFKLKLISGGCFMKKFGLSILPALLLGAALAVNSAVPASASFLLDNVTLGIAFPTTSNILATFGPTTVNPQAQFNCCNFASVIVSANQIVFTENNTTASYAVSTFNGYIITDVTNSLITGVSLDSLSTVPGVVASDIAFSANSVSLNVSGLTVPANDQIILDVTFASPVPEPATWALLLLGFAGIGFVAYRRNSKPALSAA
jgi:hypothetical protein